MCRSGVVVVLCLLTGTNVLGDVSAATQLCQTNSDDMREYIRTEGMAFRACFISTAARNTLESRIALAVWRLDSCGKAYSDTSWYVKYLKSKMASGLRLVDGESHRPSPSRKRIVSNYALVQITRESFAKNDKEDDEAGSTRGCLGRYRARRFTGFKAPAQLISVAPFSHDWLHLCGISGCCVLTQKVVTLQRPQAIVVPCGTRKWEGNGIHQEQETAAVVGPT
jgi:hypothetical protein